MAELSPAAQAVLDAAYRVGKPDRSPHDELDLPAALRAAGERLEAAPGQSHQVPGIIAAERQLRRWATELDIFLQEERS